MRLLTCGGHRAASPEPRWRQCFGELKRARVLGHLFGRDLYRSNELAEPRRLVAELVRAVVGIWTGDELRGRVENGDDEDDVSVRHLGHSGVRCAPARV